MKKTKMAYLVVGFLAAVAYFVACGGSSSKVGDAIGDVTSTVVKAVEVVYDNSVSALSANNVQAAIDEVLNRVKSIEGSISSVADNIVSSLNVLYDNTNSKLSSTNVQGAIDEVAVKVAALEHNPATDNFPPILTSQDIVGTWQSECYMHQNTSAPDTPMTTPCISQVTFKNDGTFDVDPSWGVYSNAPPAAVGPMSCVNGVGPTFDIRKYKVIGGNILAIELRITGTYMYKPIRVTYVGPNAIMTDYPYSSPSKCILTRK